MPWGRLDDRANDSPKLRLLSDSAWRMWGCGLIYCQAHLTDGFIPAAMIFEFGVKARNIAAVADELCSVKVPSKGPLWHKVDGGFQVHDYAQWNESKEQVELARLTAKQRMALFQNPELRGQIRERDGDRCRYCGRTVRWNDRKGEMGGTYDHIAPYGGNSVANLVVCCRGCNARKRGRTPDEAGMPLLPEPVRPLRSVSRSDLDISRSELGFLLEGQQEAQQATTTTTIEEQEQERFARSPQAVEISNPAVRFLRRSRSRQTDDGKPAVPVLAALARDVLFAHPGEDEGELHELLKRSCAKANLQYDGGAVTRAISVARAQLRKVANS